MAEFEGPVFSPIAFGEEPQSYKDSKGLVRCSFLAISVLVGSSFLATYKMASQPAIDAVTAVVQAKKERDVRLMALKSPAAHETPEQTEFPTITLILPKGLIGR